MKQIVKNAFVNAFGTAMYITLVGGFMYFGTLIKIGRKNTFLAPIAMLLLFVFSAALTGYLIFGKPALLYIDGKKKDALSLLTYTLIFFFIITFIVLSLLILFSR
ncbi:MAG: hypothetical protein V1803_02760 [Candidatus Roizmanbacteria bacterium]